ncbi:23S rRNA pseudouridine2605 synthase [Cyclobacterium xiamenense]|uniref:Pseudouridine synthase n=1 Tax=Cyclobacterium xiamenense TaxID=1297121 RepID=A0A1H6XP77_9BACT|nr:pseudouridine synthase [Cyclobacterium xiamenense]SEJ30878.1 23S rRNA pseudouridine2605 synthase [Cyclobacterium xiamenense]
MKKSNTPSGDSAGKSSGNKRTSEKTFRSGKGKIQKPENTPAATKSEYKGRGKNQKPIYGEAEAREPKKKRFQKPYSPIKKSGKPGKKIKTETQPEYDLSAIQKQAPKETEAIRLNKYIANAGVCSRREADTLIEKGEITVNGQVVTELGFKVSRKDKVTCRGKSIRPEKPVYLLLNKPKDFITTTDDPLERKTVMHLVEGACEERLFPVGRLDRNTTGLLLFTNDGELSARLTHPAYEIKKIYQVTLDKPIAKNDVDAIREGVTLEDGPTQVDDLQVLSLDKTILGLEIHSGKNRIVRRIFAHFGYEVIALDRVTFAGLSKKDIPRGKYRFLNEREVINLKFMNKGKNKKRLK